MKTSTFSLWVLGVFLTSQVSVARAESPTFTKIHIAGSPVYEDFKPNFRIPLQFDVQPEGSPFFGTIECWRVRQFVVFDKRFWDYLIPDKYEGSTPIKDPQNKGGPNPWTADAVCPMRAYTDSSTEYYVRIATGTATVESTDRFRGIDFPIYVTKQRYENDKIYDGRTMQDCLANDVEQYQKWTDLSSNWSVEPIVTVQLARYTFRTHKTALNAQGAGVGITFKYYPDSKIIAAGDRTEIKRETGKDKDGKPIYEETGKDKDGKPIYALYEKFDGQKDLRRVKSVCRASSFDQTDKLAASFISVGPVVFLSKPDTGDTQVQVGGIAGFFENLLQIGAGVNVSPNKHMDPFLMVGFAKGFDLPGSSTGTGTTSKSNAQNNRQ